MTKQGQGGRLAIVTGGTRGIGLEIARALAGQGYDLELWYHARKEEADQALAQLQGHGVAVQTHQVDVARRKEVQAALAGLGRSIQLLVNNAGILDQKPFATISDDDWDAMMAVNLKGAFICAQEVMPLMGKGAVIVNMASSGGQLGGMLAVHYAVSKAGIIALTKSLARVGADGGIRVNCVSPGLISTEMTRAEMASEAGKEKIRHQIPMGRPGEAAEVAAAVAFLASDEAGYITGQTLNVNGGLYMG